MGGERIRAERYLVQYDQSDCPLVLRGTARGSCGVAVHLHGGRNAGRLGDLWLYYPGGILEVGIFNTWLRLILFALLWKTYVKNTAVEAGFTDFQSVRVMKPSAAFLEHTDSSSGIGNRLGKFILASGLIWIILACLAQGVIKDGIGLWGPTMIQDIYGVDAGTASFLLLFIPVMNFMGITWWE